MIYPYPLFYEIYLIIFLKHSSNSMACLFRDKTDIWTLVQEFWDRSSFHASKHTVWRKCVIYHHCNVRQISAFQPTVRGTGEKNRDTKVTVDLIMILLRYSF